MKNCFKSLKMLFKEFPLYVFLKLYMIFNVIFETLIPIHVINHVVEFYELKGNIATGKEIGGIILYIFISFLVLFILYEIGYLINLYEDYVSRNFSNRLNERFFKKMISLDYDLYESPDFLNDYMRALEDGPSQIFNCAKGLLNLVANLLRILSLIGIIISIHISAIIYILVTGIIYFILRIFMSKINFKFHSLKRPNMRIARYSNRAFTLKDSIPDIKSTGIEEVLLDNNDKAFDEVIRLHKKYISKRTILNIICDIMLTLLYPAIILLISVFSMDNFDVSIFSSLTVAVTSLSYAINNLASTLGSLQDAIVEVVIPYELLDKEPNIEKEKTNKFTDDFKCLDIKNVKFKYNEDILALNDISMHINKGEKIAIVGINGAGKTTLVKLLLHLYNPLSGEILINNTNYNEIDSKSLRLKVGAVFQNIETYAATVAENILLRKVSTKEDIDLVNESLKFSGLYDFVYSLKDNINTQVSREFLKEGIVFSGGQKQKLAIARGYAQNYQVFILDEPSSSLDPLAEARVYKNMLELGKDKTMIFISHRLTTTVNVDKIYLFDRGQILEQGTHEELIKENGLYKKMFDSQAVKYLGEDYE